MVYVDNMNAQFRNMVMCHMIADDTTELLLMACAIGVDLKWIQYPGTHREHFDVCLTKKHAALMLGAEEITWLECGRKTLAKAGLDISEW